MAAFLVTGTEYSETAGGSPTRDQIRMALRPLADHSRAYTVGGLERRRAIGQWAGPEPRVTKVVVPLSTGNGFRTRVAWVYVTTETEDAQLATPEARQTFADNLRADANQELQAHAGLPNLSRNNWDVIVAGYDPAVNGDPAWWESGGAARDARWVDTFPPFLEAPFPDDNPTGPNNLHPNPESSKPLTTLAWLVGGVAVVYGLVTFGPAIASWVPTKSKPAHAGTAVQNPRKRR